MPERQSPTPSLRIMATREHLRAELMKRGEAPPRQWTKAELQQRLEELTGVNAAMSPAKGKKQVSEYQDLIQKMNQAARRKGNLIEFCQETLGMLDTDNMTIPQLVRAATLMIYQKSTPDPTDAVGFGRHGALTYEQLKEQNPSYCEWVKKTAMEGECDPRLQRLAGWLTDNPSLVKIAMRRTEERASASSAPTEPMNSVKSKPKAGNPKKEMDNEVIRKRRLRRCEKNFKNFGANLSARRNPAWTPSRNRATRVLPW